jgi:hypothetical protein
MSSARERATALAADAGKPAPLARVSPWLDYVKAYAEKNKITYKQALKDASPSYKTRNETIVEPEVKATTETSKPKRKYNKKDKSII